MPCHTIPCQPSLLWDALHRLQEVVLTGHDDEFGQEWGMGGVCGAVCLESEVQGVLCAVYAEREVHGRLCMQV